MKLSLDPSVAYVVVGKKSRLDVLHITFWGVRGSLPAPFTPREVTEKITAALASAACEDLTDEESLIKYVKRLPSV